MIKVVAFDLDGTLTQHRSALTCENKAALDALAERYTLLMAGAGQVQRIFDQLGGYPINIIGNYGLQYGEYDPQTGTVVLKRNVTVPCDRDSVKERITRLRERFGFTEFAGDTVEYHPSGCVTFPLLGTKALLPDKLAFDPDRRKRREIYAAVAEIFNDFSVFVGGSSSFDMAPKPFDKAYALDQYCRENGLSHDELCYVGDDYGLGGNDESVYRSDFPYLTIDNYLDFPRVIRPLLDGSL